MYTGNGAAKKFAIPSGYSGNNVYLTVGGQYVEMTAGEQYEISGEYIEFREAVPSGVEISFEPPSLTEASKMKATSYTVIYGDGTISQVNEDPALMLETVRDMLEKATGLLQEVKVFASSTLTRIEASGQAMTAEFEGRLLGYTARAEDAISEAAASVRTDLKGEITTALEEVRTATQEVQTVQAKRNLQAMQAMTLQSAEVSTSAEAAAEKAAATVADKCSCAIEAYSQMSGLKAEMQELYEAAKYAAETVGREIQTSFTHKINEELEMLKSLRLRMELDYETVKKKIDSRLELLKGGRRKCSVVSKSSTERC